METPSLFLTKGDIILQIGDFNYKDLVFIVDNESIGAFTKTPNNELKFLGYVNYHDYIEQITPKPKMVTPILPLNTIYYKRQNNMHECLVCLPPQKYLIKHVTYYYNDDDDSDGEIEKLFEISLPYLLFRIKINQVGNILTHHYSYCGMTLSKPTKENVKIYHPLLPNVSMGLAICYGGVGVDLDEKQSLSQIVENLITAFLTGRSNNDYHITANFTNDVWDFSDAHLQHLEDEGCRADNVVLLHYIEHLSKNDPLWWMKDSTIIKEANFTLADFLSI